jgi:hypothetical protein
MNLGAGCVFIRKPAFFCILELQLKHMLKALLLPCVALLFSVPVLLKAQCPVITCPSTISVPCSSVGVQVVASSNYTANIVSRWLVTSSPNFAPFTLASSGVASSTVFLNHAGTYTVEFQDYVSGCVATQTVLAIAPSAPTFDMSALSSIGCPPVYIVNLNLTNPQSPTGGQVSTAISPANTAPFFGPGATSAQTGGCGDYYLMAKDAVSGCISSYSITLPCVDPLPIITVNMPGPICVGSPYVLMAAGTAVSYTWSTGANSSAISVTPTAPSNYSVAATNAQGCVSTIFISAIHCSSTAIGETNPDEAGVRVFPNPTRDRLNLHSDAPTEIPYTLYDLSGRQIIQGELIRSRSLDLSALESGLYLLRLQTPDGLLCKRILIE